MDLAEERAAYVALALTPGIGAVRLAALLDRFGSALGALSAPFAFLGTVPGLTRAAATAVANATLEQGVKAIAAAEEQGGACLLATDPGFPAALREIPDPPPLLFVMGDLALLGRPAVAVVGSRDNSAYGAEVCQAIAGGAAAAGLCIVSGMARGLDAAAHRAALDAEGATIGILGNGLGVVYPAANRPLYEMMAARGLLLTEFAPGERPGVGAFPRRNRLISGLARVTVVIEAAAGSGALITVGTALAQGKDVMAVPGNVTSATSVGTNQLIRDGAEPLLELGDLLAHFEGLRRPEAPLQVGLAVPPPPDLPPLERLLLEALTSGPVSVDQLVARSGRTAAEALAALSALELRGLVREERGCMVAAGPEKCLSR